MWNRDATIPVGLGLEMPVNGLIRDIALIAISLLSWWTTPRNLRVENAFTWAPMQEVAMLFAAIFITMIPMLALLKAGSDGPFAPLLSLVSTPEGAADRGRLFLADRHLVELPRQRADLSRVLQSRRRRRESADGAAGADTARHLVRRRVHGRR